MKKLRFLQFINLWRLIPAYICTFTSTKDDLDIIVDELYHWKKCDQRNESGKFDLFSALLIERKEYRSLLQYRLRGGGTCERL